MRGFCQLAHRVDPQGMRDVNARLRERYGMDAQAMATDDGIVLRLPQGEKEPDSSLFAFDADDMEALAGLDRGERAARDSDVEEEF